jgi:hypothetical protein
MRPNHGQAIGMVSIPGDRRDEDIRRMGEISAETFDHLVFREQPDDRGRPRGEVMRLLQEGALGAGFPAEHIHCLLREPDAVARSLRAARPGDLVVLLPTEVERTWKTIMEFEGPHEPFEAEAGSARGRRMSRGPLIIIGGHEEKEGGRTILKEVAKRVKGGKLVIATVASHRPEGYFESYQQGLRGLGRGRADRALRS